MKRTVIIIIAVLIFLAIPATVFLAMRNQELRQKAAPATSITLSPSSLSKQVGDEFTLEIRMNTADNQVVATQVSLAFDPEKLEAVWIHNGTMFPNIISSGIVGNGAASIAVGAANTTTPITGAGLVATVKLKALASTTSPIAVRFDADTFVGALGEGSTNVLTSTTPSTITIARSAAADSAVTPAATQSATLTPTLEPAQESTDSASQSAVTIVSPIINESVTTQTPIIQGKAPPGSTVTIAVYSTQQITATVTADENGDWTYSVSEPLEPGAHTIVVAAQNPTSGETNTATIAFVVSDGSAADLTGDEMPVSGSVEPTLLLIGLGLFFLISGSLMPMFYAR